MSDKPIDMVLHCPRCGRQHIDAPDEAKGWDNPAHRSHLCGHCNYIWRPCDQPTNGVLALQTKGEKDMDPIQWEPIKKVGISHPYRDRVFNRKCYVRGFDVDDGAAVLVELCDDDGDISGEIVTREWSELMPFEESKVEQLKLFGG